MPKIYNPESVGTPPTYSHGIEVPSTGRVLYISGQVGMSGGSVVAGGIVEQTRTVFANLKAVLNDAGMDYSNIVKTTSFLTHPADFADFAKTRGEILGDLKPASTLVFISQLVHRDMLVEVEAVAVAE